MAKSIKQVEADIQSVMGKFISGVQKLFSKPNLSKANKIAQGLSKLATFLLPLSLDLAKQGGNTTNVHLIEAAQKMNTSVADILAKTDEADKDGTLQVLLKNTVIGVVEKAVETGTVDLGPIGTFKTGSPVVIPKHFVDAAGSFAYATFVKPNLPAAEQPPPQA
jgi:hypothetical protein